MTRRRNRRSGGGRPLPEAPDGPPTVVSVETDYALAWPLVDRSPGVVGVLDLSPHDLGTSAALAERLREPAVRWDHLSRRWIADGAGTPESERAEAQWDEDRLAVAHDLRHELGGEVEVLVDGVPVAEWHQRRRRTGRWRTAPDRRS